MIRHFLFLFCLSLFLSLSLAGQHDLTPAALNKVPQLVLPVQDNDALLTRELAARRPGRPITFAVRLPVKVRPATAGEWFDINGTPTWRLRVHSPGAKSLNLGFSEYQLPEGAELYLSTPAERYGPFSAADNADHNQFWSPILEGDELLVELRVPRGKKDQVRLYLTAVNHDFEGIVESLSGSCNLDVICGAENGFGLVEDYRDVIRSVAAFSLNGTNACSGFLVNNSNEDGRPLFMTAEHCQVDNASGPSLVAYWNYQNSNCRTPGGNESGAAGDGSRRIFNTGVRLLADYEGSDFTLVEFVEPVNSQANAFFAGWSAAAALPQDTVLSVHHPRVQEKRISFSFQQVERSDPGGSINVPDGPFLKVSAWDIGTTEGGSSGAPLFDSDGRVRGQLFGGEAACGNAAYDAFGFFYVSWTGGGTPESRLMDWLDPCGTQTDLTLDGFDQSKINSIVTAETNCRTACVDENLSFQLKLGRNFSSTTSITVVDDNPLNLQLPATAAGGSTIRVNYLGSTGAPQGRYPVTLRFDGDVTDDITLIFNLIGNSPPAPMVLLPADGATDVDPTEAISWRPEPDASLYDVQLSTTQDFTAIIAGSNGLDDSVLDLNFALDPNQKFFWRVRGRNECGVGAWSPTYSFTTSDISCGFKTSDNLPVDISFAGSSTVMSTLAVSEQLEISTISVRVGIDHSFVGDLEASLISPSGTSVTLFEPISSGSCSAENLYVTFTDGASAGEIECLTGNPNDYVAYRPAMPLSRLVGEEARGTWQLVVTDFADLDGGAITDFEILFCQVGSDGRDLSVSATDTSLVGCTNQSISTNLELGVDYTDELSLRVEAGGMSLDNYTFDFNPNSQLLTVNFSAWTLLGSGEFDLRFVVIGADGTERTTAIPLTVLPVPDVVTSISPAMGEQLDRENALFEWSATDESSSYNLQFSETSNFSSIYFEETTSATSLVIDATDFPDKIFWRVVANNPCGSATGSSRSVSFSTVGTYDLGEKRTVNIYPNPTTGQLNIDLGSGWSRELAVTLFDVGGRVVSGPRQLDGSGINTLYLDHLTPGVYYLRLDDRGRSLTDRIIVMP